MSSFFKKAVKVAAPIIGGAFGGPIGASLGSALSGGGGGGLGGILSGGLTSGLTGGFGGGSLGSLLGGGGGLASSVLGGGASGGGGLLSSVLGGGSTGGLLSGVGGGFLSGGGASSLGGGSGMLGGLLGGGGILGSALNFYQAEKTNDDILDKIRQGANKSIDLYQPYRLSGERANQQLSDALAAGFNPENLQDDPSYQFRLNQGQNALTRSLGASGLSQSGAALKAAQDYGQGLASQEYANAYNRWLAQNQQLGGVANMGLGASNSLSGIYGDLSGAEALIKAKDAENKNNLLSGLLGGGLGIFGGF